MSAEMGAVRWAKSMIEDKAARKKACHEAFGKADADGSGTLESPEVVTLVTKMCADFHLKLPKKEKIETLVKLCDKNGDGVLQESEFNGFFKCVLESAVKHATEDLAKLHKKPIGGAKNGGSREVSSVKAPKYYPAEDVPVKVPSVRELQSRGTAKLRASIEPGSVLILLAGRFRGRRVVFLKQLSSGLLLVSGPYCVNGVPLRRVNQAYVIATSTKVDVGAVDVSKFKDDYFGKAKKAGKKKKGEEFFEEAAAKSEPTAERLADQKAVDAKLMPAIEKTPLMANYLKARFSLSKAQKPHLMKF